MRGGFIRTVAAVDLSLSASGVVLGSSDYVVATILNASGTLYTLVLVVGSLKQAGVEGVTGLVPLWIFRGLACLGASWVLLRNLQPARR